MREGAGLVWVGGCGSRLGSVGSVSCEHCRRVMGCVVWVVAVGMGSVVCVDDF